MPTTANYIDMLRDRTETRSDYAVARYLGISEDAVNQYRKGKRAMSPDVALLIAEKLQLPILEVLADAQYEHAKTPEMRKKWAAVRKLWAQVAKIALIAICANLPEMYFMSRPAGVRITEGWTNSLAWASTQPSKTCGNATPSSDGYNNYASLWRSLWRRLRRHWGNGTNYPTLCALAP